MNPALQALRQFKPSHIREHPMMHDTISVATLGVALALNVVTVLLLILKVHHVDYPVPVHYLNLVGFDKMGGWYQTYRIGAFGLVVTVVNGMLAAKSFQRNRLSSFYLLMGAAVTALLCLVIGLAFAVIV